MTDNPALRTISVQGVSRTFGKEVTAVSGVSMQIAAGSFTVIVGPSGCGKTTLLRMIGGLDQPTEGRIEFIAEAGMVVAPVRAGVSFAFQEPRLLPWRTVRQNIALPLEIHGVRNPERHERAMDLAGQVGLQEAYHRLPAQLSGGMKMRTAIARALVTEPDVLLLDEPFGSLDEITRGVLDDLLLALWKKSETTVIMVTHSIAEAVYLGQSVVVMSRGPGKIVETIAPTFEHRSPELRVTPEFAAVTARVQQALAQGMAVRP